MRYFTRRKVDRYLVSLGAGANQLPLIREAKKLGLRIIGVDEDLSAPGIHQCDIKIQESIHDHESIYAKLREFIINGPIAAIMTRSFGKAVRTASYLNERYELPHLPFSSAEAFIDKARMKSLFDQCGIPTPKIIRPRAKQGIARAIEENLPVIVKPIVGHAKTGIRLFRSRDEIDSSIFRGRFTSNYLVERFIEGDEIIVSGIVHEGVFYLAHISDKKKSGADTFIDIEHSCPSVHRDLTAALSRIGQSVADGFNIRTSPLIMEFVIDGEGNPLIIEAVPEFGGECLTDYLVPATTGYNFTRQCICAAAGTTFIPPKHNASGNPVVVRYSLSRKGRLSSFDDRATPRMRGYVFHRVLKNSGDDLRAPSNNQDRLAVVVCTGATVAEAAARAEAAEKSLHLEITDARE